MVYEDKDIVLSPFTFSIFMVILFINVTQFTSSFPFNTPLSSFVVKGVLESPSIKGFDKELYRTYWNTIVPHNRKQHYQLT